MLDRFRILEKHGPNPTRSDILDNIREQRIYREQRIPSAAEILTMIGLGFFVI
jgi:hypothetical protein